MENKKNKKEKLPNLSTLGQQMVMKKVGVYCTERMSIDLYYFFEAINIIISDRGEDWVDEICKKNGKDWGEIKEKLEKINRLVNITKTFYDPIQDKAFERKDKDKKLTETQAYFRRYIFKTTKRISLMQRDIYDIFFLLVNNTSLKIKTIPSGNFNLLEHQKLLDLRKKKSYSDVVKKEE